VNLLSKETTVQNPHLPKQLGNLSGAHETPGQFTYGDFDSDMVDLDVVAKHLKSKYGYVVTTMISHSKASMVTMRYLCTHEEVAADVKCFVNVAGRYRMVSPISLFYTFGISDSRMHVPVASPSPPRE
jgi:hypothetical protein